MSWRDRTAEILGNVAEGEPTKPTKALLMVLKAPPPAHSDEYAELVALVHRVADREGWADQDRAEELERAAVDAVGRLELFRAIDNPAHAEVPAEAPQHSPRDPGANTAEIQRLRTELAEAREALDVARIATAHECGVCRNLDMQQGPMHNGRRGYVWTCTKGYRILRAGLGAEDLRLAPPECRDYDDTPAAGIGVYH